MPLDYDILNAAGTTEKRIREIFTACPKNKPEHLSGTASDEYDKDIDVHNKLDAIFQSRIQEGVDNNLKSSDLLMAIDLAWDSPTISQQDIPLVLYAQGRISAQTCVNQLKDLQCVDKYVTQNEDKSVSIKTPKFTDVHINLVKSIIGRRKAAQSARYSNLYPFFKYEQRGTSEPEKLLADCMSQRTDIMADQFGYRDAHDQWILDMLLYPHCVVFPACKWLREVEWKKSEAFTAESFQTDKPTIETRVKREGVPLVCPHPSRVFYDTAHPIKSINSDTGCKYFGFWDVVRYGDILDDNNYFNRSAIGYNQQFNGYYSKYSNYFSQYYTSISLPGAESSFWNDRESNAGSYSAEMLDAPVYRTHLYCKLVPSEWRMGKYPWPVWFHFVIANTTVIGAEIMPDTPGAVFSFNQNAHRLLGLSMAMDVLPFQDQLSNFYSQLLEVVKRDLLAINFINLDCFPEDSPEAQKLLKEFENALAGNNFKTGALILKAALSKLKGVNVDVENIFKTIRQPANSGIQEIMTCINLTILLTERVMSMSPQEQAQFNPRETSATEMQVVVGTTENMFQHISDSIDDGRSALKRYLYNATISCGSKTFTLPVIGRYAPSVATALGFEVTNPESTNITNAPARFTVKGKTESLIAEYIFTARDGADRSSNMQAAQTLVQMAGVMAQPPFAGMVNQGQMAEILTEIVRKSGAGIDLIIEPPPGASTQPLMPAPVPEPIGPEVAKVAPAR